MNKTTSGTHRPMGKKGGASAGLVNGVAEVHSYKAGQGVEVVEKTQRPKAVKGGSIAMK